MTPHERESIQTCVEKLDALLKFYGVDINLSEGKTAKAIRLYEQEIFHLRETFRHHGKNQRAYISCIAKANAISEEREEILRELGVK